MAVTLRDPTARLLDLPPREPAPASAEDPADGRQGRQRAERRRRRRQAPAFTVYTAKGAGSYRSRAKAVAAASWVAETSGGSISVVDERTGELWEVAAPARRDP
jgi:hypothetical protein